MKTMKKLTSLLLVLLMVVGMMSITAWAAGDDEPAAPATTPTGNIHTPGDDDSHTVTIKGVSENQVFVAYQIFAGDYYRESDEAGTAKGTLSNITWGSGVDIEPKGKLQAKDTDEISKYLNGKDPQTAKEWADFLTDYVDNSDVAKAFAQLVNGHLTGTGIAEDPNMRKEGNAGFSALPDGYYLIKNSSVGTDTDGNSETYTEFMLEVVGDVQANVKSDIPEVDKEITKSGEDGKVDEDGKKSEAAIGDEIEYKITGTLPDNYDAYKYYFYEFVDTFDPGLTFSDDDVTDEMNVKDDAGNWSYVKVTADGKDVTEFFTVNYDAASRKLTVTCNDLKKIEGLTSESKIVVTYSDTLNEKAEVAPKGNDNKVKLRYETNPNYRGNGEEEPDEPGPDRPVGETPDRTVTTFTTELDLTKVIGGTDTPLAGAEFTLIGDNLNEVKITTAVVYTEDANGDWYLLKDGTYTQTAPGDDVDETAYDSTTTKYTKSTEVRAETVGANGESISVVVGEVDAQGKVTFTGLRAGNYTLKETKTPDGYNTMADITFTIEVSFSGEEGSYTATFTVTNVKQGDKEFSADADDCPINSNGSILSGNIANYSGATLPETGGIGTTIFYAVGGLLAVGAVILLITKRRMNISE